ncbi:MAG TPA: fatty acid oxidation complex subunit alpha FadJ [Gemmatimonadales bacterium]|nr:fatty acid oxidation complex subunit alpha FadJ [Gemmatimonadales bacterium]
MPALSTELDGSIAVVTIDLPGEPVNTLSTALSAEFDRVLADLERDQAVLGVVLISGKPDSFIAGADITEFSRVASAADAERLSREAQEMMARVARFPKPVVAAIHGACLGGGCELALASHWRVATDHPKTQLGLPEIQLGVIPGAGGTQRLPRLIGLRAALDIILAGKSERAPKAFRVGLVDELVHPAILREVAVAAARRLARDGVPKREPRGQAKGAAAAVLDRTSFGRAIVYKQARATVLQKTGGHYPAPLAALEAVRTGLEDGEAKGYAVEQRKFGELAVSPVSRKLVQIFFATTALKKDDGVGAGVPVHAEAVRHVGVVGSGFMGAGIAGTAVLNAGVDVRMRDTELARVGKGLTAARGILDERLKRRRLTRPQHQRLVAELSGGADYRGFGRADLVIEAVFEDLGVKRQVLAEVEAATRPDAIFATNTSTIPIAQIAAGAARPERVLGMHFFSPVEKMPLLEVIPTDRTAPDAIVTAVRFGRKLGKTVIVVADSPGFWVNRILSPYLNEAGLLLEEGVPIDLLDDVMHKRFGFPVGPATLLDEVGLDVAQKAGTVMYEAFGERLRPSAVVTRLIEDGRLGRKNGRGFHLYEDGKKGGVDEGVYRLLGITPKPDASPTMVEQRLVYAMLNEAAMAVAEGVVRTPRDGDIGAIFGIGFPPFRGGPLRLIDDLGAARVVEVLEGLREQYGERFAPAPSLVQMGLTGERYYSD